MQNTLDENTVFSNHIKSESCKRCNNHSRYYNKESEGTVKGVLDGAIEYRIVRILRTK